jgi:hypothetical protein
MATKRLHGPHDYTPTIVEGVVTLATLPALCVGVAEYSFHYNAIRFVAWLFDGDRKEFWRYFHHYLTILLLIWALFIVLAFIRDHQRTLNGNSQ